MASLEVFYNPFVSDGKLHHVDGRLIDWMIEHYPKGFGGPIVIRVNGDELPIDHADIELKKEDYVSIEVRPADPVNVLAQVAVALIMSAISYALTNRKLPKAPNGMEPEDENPVYSLRQRSNPVPGLGEVIPVNYGEVVTTPPFASRPYYTHTAEYTGVAKPIIVSMRVSFTYYYTISSGIYGTIPIKGTYSSQVIGPQHKYLWRNMGGGQVSLWDLGTYELGRIVDDFAVFGQRYGEWVFSSSRIWPWDGDYVTFVVPYNAQYTYTLDVDCAFSTEDYYVDRDGVDGDQFLNMLFVLGQGKHLPITPDDIMIGNVKLSSFSPEHYRMLDCPQSLHLNQLGRISDLFNPTVFTKGDPVPFHENVITSPAVGGQEFEKETDASLFFPISDTITQERIDVDIEFSRGLFYITETGAFSAIEVVLEITIDQYDPSTGVTIASSAKPFRFVNYGTPNTNAFRRTMTFNRPAGYYRVKVRRLSPKPDTKGSKSDMFRWIGLRGYASIIDTTVIPQVRKYAYGETHLLALRLKANDVISRQSSTQVQVRVKRVIVVPGEIDGQPGLKDRHTRNPAAIAYNILTQPNYGGGRPISEFDTSRFSTYYFKWAAANGFNGVFNQRITLYEALQTVLQPVMAKPLALGSLLSVQATEVKYNYTQLFTEANIVEDSFRIAYEFDSEGAPSGYEVAYRDNQTWQERTVVWPDGSNPAEPRPLQPIRVNLFGCSDPNIALGAAKYFWNRNYYNRKRLTFDVEHEGMIPVPGDKIAVQHSLVDYTQGGIMVEYDAWTKQMTVDCELEFQAGQNHAMVLRREDGTSMGVYEVTQVDSNTVQLTRHPSYSVRGVLEDNPTHFAFGTVNKLVTEITVDAIVANGQNLFTIEGSIYDERTFQNTLSFMSV